MIDEDLDSFADELAERMTARADRIDVTPDDPSMWVGVGAGSIERTQVTVQRKPIAWLAAAAALLVVVGLGTTALRDSPRTVTLASDTETLISDELLEFGRQDSPIELIVWVHPDASDEEVDEVQGLLEADSRITSFRYMNEDATYEEFLTFWSDSPEVVAAVTPQDLPTSFRVVADDPATVASRFEQIAGVLKTDIGPVRGQEQEGVRADGEVITRPAVPGPGPLYLLPPPGFEGLDEVVFVDDVATEDDGRATVVGRVVESGFESVILVTFVDWDPTGPVEIGDIEIIDGRELVRGLNDWSEEVPGGWLVFTADEQVPLSEVVRATQVVDGEAFVDPTLLDELSVLRTVDLPGPDGVVSLQMITPNPDEVNSVVSRTPIELESVLSIPWVTSPGDLVIWGFTGRSMEETTVRGRTGYFIRPGTSEFGSPWSSLAWSEASGHLVMITLDDATDEELIAYAEALRVVDRQTWEGELSALE